jgi:2-phosphosulfolactate phosphatase
MNVDVLFRPADLRPEHGAGRAVVVFDVLRATTTMTAALAAGVREIRVFPSVEAARSAAGGQAGLLCGEEKCLLPAGFDLGNSPGAFEAALHKDKRLFMCTTNGTRAILAAREASRLLVGALVNARAVARRLDELGLDVTLLCAGTNGQIAMEDVLGAGAVLAELNTGEVSDTGRMARRLFEAAGREAGGMVSALRDSAGGRNVIAAGLGGDIEFAARVNAFEVVGEVKEGPLRVELAPFTFATDDGQGLRPDLPANFIEKIRHAAYEKD